MFAIIKSDNAFPIKGIKVPNSLILKGKLNIIIKSPIEVRILESILKGRVEFFEFNLNLKIIVMILRNSTPNKTKKSKIAKSEV